MKKIYIIALAALALTACDKNDDNPAPSPVAAKITATIAGGVRTRAKDNSWAEEDKIGVTAKVNKAEEPFVNMEYTTLQGDGNFTGEAIYIYNPMSLTAYYPYTGSKGTYAGVISTRTSAERQTAAEQAKFDFLFASKEGITTDNPTVKFEFAHKMSKLTIIFQDGEGMDVGNINSCTIDGLILDGTFDTATGACAATAGLPAESLAMSLSDVKSGETAQTLILFPQQLDSEETVRLTITDIYDQSYACYLKFAGNSLTPGDNYQFTVKVNKTGLTVADCTISDWETKPIPTEAGSDWKSEL